MSTSAPPLDVSETGDRVRLTLRGLTHGEGETLQEAADDLVHRVLLVAMAFRTSGVGRITSESRLDVALLEFVLELGEIAAHGGDIRSRLFGAEHGP